MEHANDHLSLLHDFMDETNFEQFIALIRGETAEPTVKFCPNYECEHINGCLADDNQFVPPQLGALDQNTTTTTSIAVSDPNSMLNSFSGEVDRGEEENEWEESSGTMTTSTTKADRSKTLVSERRRRGRMKEKLYALRSLVPNITKMDKASIVGDAASYVQELQMQAKKLRAEIAGLETSLTGADQYQPGSYYSSKKFQVPNTDPIFKRVTQMDVFQVDERGFYVRVVCNKGQGVAAALYKALESFTYFKVQSSNLATDPAADSFVFTFTLKVREQELEMNLPNLKLWLAGALINQGFDFASSPISA